MRKLNKLLAVLAMALGLVSSVWAVPIEVKQYYNAGTGTFVLSPTADEQRVVESGAVGKWQLASSFFAESEPGAGRLPVCRAFYNVAGLESHFHSAIPAECAALKTLPGWIVESEALFYVNIAAASVCRTGVPLYRVWNGLANHALVPDATWATRLLGDWAPSKGLIEGVAMCVANYGTPFTGIPTIGTPPVVPPPAGNSAGKVDLYMTADGGVMTITPTLIEGQIVAVGAEGQGWKLDPATVTSGCLRGNTFGWEGDTKACAPVVGNKVTIPGLCNRDRGMPTLRAGDKEYFLNFTDLNIRWELAGLNAKVVNAFVEYAQTGEVKKPQVAVVNGKLTLAFNRDCESGFGLNKVPTDFSTALAVKYVFVSTTGPNTEAYGGWDDVNKAAQVVFEGLKCTDTGNVQVFLPKMLSTDGKTVVDWMPDPAGWLALGVPPDEPNLIWDFGPGVTPVIAPPVFGFTYRLPGC